MRIELGLHFGEAGFDLGALPGEHLRHQFAQGGDFVEDAVEALIEQLGQLGAFAGTAGLEFTQCLVEQLQSGSVQRLRVGRVGHQHAGPGQHFQRVERGRLLDQCGDLFGSGNQLAGAVGVDLQRLAGTFFGEAQGALHLAARQALAQRFAHRAFEVAEGFRQAQVRLEITVVDRAQLPAQCAVSGCLLIAGKGRHAVNHGIPRGSRLEKRRIVAHGTHPFHVQAIGPAICWRQFGVSPCSSAPIMRTVFT